MIDGGANPRDCIFWSGCRLETVDVDTQHLRSGEPLHWDNNWHMQGGSSCKNQKSVFNMPRISLLAKSLLQHEASQGSNTPPLMYRSWMGRRWRARGRLFLRLLLPKMNQYLTCLLTPVTASSNCLTLWHCVPGQCGSVETLKAHTPLDKCLCKCRPTCLTKHRGERPSRCKTLS